MTMTGANTAGDLAHSGMAHRVDRGTWVVGLDGSDCANNALEWAVSNVEGRASSIELVTAWQTPVAGAYPMSSPVTVIVAYDPKFYDYLPRLFPHTDAKPWFTSNPELAQETAFRNGTLQGAYFLMAARALGFGVGPMSGFDNAKVDAEFLSDRGWKSNFLVNLGHGDQNEEKPRGPRFWFDETCLIL